MQNKVTNMLIILVTCFGLWLPMASSAQAQSTDTVVFVHGLNQSGSAWSALANDLASRHSLDPWYPTLSSKSSFSTQASQLGTALASIGMGPHGAISHSNGGIVSREYVRTTGSPLLDRHLSLGTPHHGAALADAAYDGSIGVMLQMATEIVDPFFWFAHNDANWPYLQLDGTHAVFAENLVDDVSDFIIGVLPTSMEVLGYFTNGWGTLPDVLPDMRPGSSFLNNLNASGSLSDEAQLLSEGRVSISTQYPSDLAPYRAVAIGVVDPLFANIYAEEMHNAVTDLQLFALDAYWYYFGHADWQLRNNAYRWWDAAIVLGSFTSVWGTLTGIPASQGDGIVPWSSSAYPGGTRDYTVSCSALCIHHTEQLWDWQLDTNPLRQRVSHAIENDLYAEPPPPLSVSIDGPTIVPAAESCNWSADVAGGQGGTSYSWSGILSGSNQNISGQVQQAGWLYLSVTRGQEQEGDELYVTVDSLGIGTCPF